MSTYGETLSTTLLTSVFSRGPGELEASAGCLVVSFTVF